MKKIPLHIKILVALILGTIFGIVFHIDHNSLVINYKSNSKITTIEIKKWETVSFLVRGDTVATFADDEQPAIVNALKKDERIFYNRIQTLYDFFFLLSLGVAMISSVWSEDIILLTFGEQYQSASDILTVYIWASIFVFHGCIRGEYLVVLNKQVIGLQFRIIGVVINIILNYFLIKQYGVIGSAYATVISFALPVYLLAMKHDVLRRDLLITWKAYLFLWVFKK